ncbi:hypothetical protein CALCODRAFT_496458 [Calocera cornea HHB12733]|uniref:Zn(2)-C6 fungal-type domain-containing protein n=1 Tax=Calocera cornea HHB12733 TaxID=1353952 RepID=A0A165FST8_9BASI|nr:hypothetical protein CALCODRAFT_496458 [Calocera cornea HHB12733]
MRKSPLEVTRDRNPSIMKREVYFSCDSCKLRRVRCERASEDRGCLKCIQKGIHCTTAGPKEKKSRSGKRIEQAKALFGPGRRIIAASSQSSLVPYAGTGLTTPSCHRDTYDMRGFDSTVALPLTMDSPNARLSVAEIVGTLSSHLIAEYFRTTHYRPPLYRWKDFHEQFEDAGRRPEQMSGMGGVLAHALIAYGAYASNAPAILGPGAPTMTKIEAEEVDFIHWGRERAAVSKRLVDRAVQAADEHGVYRKECNESIVILLLLEMLVDHGDASGRKGRPFRTAAVEHARTLYDEDSTSDEYAELQGGGLGWHLYTRDTVQAAVAGRAPRLQDEDVQRLRGVRSWPIDLPTMEEFSKALSGDILIWIPVIRIWDHVSQIIRQLAIRMATDAPALEPPNDPFADDLMRELYRDLDETEQCVRSMQAQLSQHFVVEQPSYTFLQFYCNTSSLGCALVVFLVHRGINQELQRLNERLNYAHLESLDPGHGLSEHEERRAKLLQLKHEVDGRMQKCARWMAATLWAMQNALSSRTGMGIMVGITMMYETFPMFAEVLCTVPSTEEGGSEDFPLETKIQEIGWLLSTYRSLGWSWADMADSIQYLEEQHQRFVAIRSAICLTPPQSWGQMSAYSTILYTSQASTSFGPPALTTIPFNTEAAMSSTPLSDPFTGTYGLTIPGQYANGPAAEPVSIPSPTSYDDLQQWASVFDDQPPPNWDFGQSQ